MEEASVNPLQDPVWSGFGAVLFADPMTAAFWYNRKMQCHPCRRFYVFILSRTALKGEKNCSRTVRKMTWQVCCCHSFSFLMSLRPPRFLQRHLANPSTDWPDRVVVLPAENDDTRLLNDGIKNPEKERTKDMGAPLVLQVHIDDTFETLCFRITDIINKQKQIKFVCALEQLWNSFFKVVKKVQYLGKQLQNQLHPWKCFLTYLHKFSSKSTSLTGIYGNR